MSGSSTYKTKLCILYNKTGNCSRPNCTFAHGNAELRRLGDSSFTGRRHNVDNDLRDRIGRQFSPERRPSLDRNGRRVQRFNGHENPRPFVNRRDQNYRENRRFGEQSDYAGGLNVGNRIEDRTENGRNKFQGYNNLEEQLKDVEMDVKMLTDDKLRLEASIERKSQEADILTSRIEDLETQLDREKEECRRITSSTKKFVKEYNRFLRAQDDRKRSEARLQKLGIQLSMYLAGSEGNDRDDADMEIVSDEENHVRSLRTACDPQNELQHTSSLPRKKHYVDHYITKEPVEDDLIRKGEEEKMEESMKKRPSRWNMGSSKSYSEEESGAWNEEDTINKSSSKEGNWKRRRLSIGNSSSDKVMSSTSMAAREFDEVAEFDEENTEAAKDSPIISLPPPPPLRNGHFQRNEEDVMEQRKANEVDSV